MSPVDINKAIYWYQTDFFRLDSSSDQRLKVGLPLHSAPQPLLEASVMTTFLLCAMSKITPCFSQRRSLQWSRADTQAQVNVMRWPGTVQTGGPFIDTPPPRMRISRIVCDAGLPGYESKRLWFILLASVISNKNVKFGLVWRKNTFLLWNSPF